MTFLQCNLQHSKGATSLVSRNIAEGQANIYLLQEPWVYRGRVRGFNSLDSTLYYKRDNQLNPRTCIYVDRRIETFPIPNLCHRDLVALKITLKDEAGHDRPLVICSAYLPYDSTEDPPTRELVELIDYCRVSGLPVIIGCDANAHHTVWGSTDTNSRGTSFLEYLNTTDLEILNQGTTPTFVTSRRQEVIDLTLGTFSIVSKVRDWKVSDEPSLSDHRRIIFKLGLTHNTGLSKFRIPRTTDWAKYTEALGQNLDIPLMPCCRTQHVEKVANFVEKAIVSSYEVSCRLRTFRAQKRTAWWNSELEKARKETRRLFNRAMRSKQPADWEEHSNSQRKYKSLIRRSKRESWRTYCENIDNLPEAAKLQRILAKDPGRHVGTLKLPSGRFTSTAEEALSWLLETHFPGSEPINTVVSSHVAPHAVFSTANWKVAAKVVTMDKIKWAINTFGSFKSAGPDGIFPALLQKGLELLLPHLLRLFRACLALGYIPQSWRRVRVVFIPKPGRINYEEAKDFRPISLSCFLLKAVEKMVDAYIRCEVLMTTPLHPNQHAYRTAMSTETALHNLVSRLERGIHSKEIALSVFLDIEGAFNYTTFDSISEAARSFGIDDAVVRWIRAMLESRIISSSINSVTLSSTVVRGCPQGGVLSPLLWCLVLDGLLHTLNEEGAYAQGYADDIAIIVTGKFTSTVKELMQKALGKVERWCRTHSLSVNPDKTEVVAFTNRRNVDLRGLTFYGRELEPSKSVKYLGVTLDYRLNWKQHVSEVVRKATVCLWACRRTVGYNWGLKPRIVHWLYTAVIRPMITYGVLVWWPATRKVSYKRQLSKLQRFVCLGVTGALRTTPTLAMEAILGLVPLYLHLEAEARKASVRLNDWSQWCRWGRDFGHGRIWSDIAKSDPLLLRRDAMPPVLSFNKKYKILVPNREQWLQPDLSLFRPGGLIWYTDGSRTEAGSGAGIYGAQPKVKISFALGRCATVFQAELSAILACVQENLQRGYTGKHIYICSDSQAVLSALEMTRVNSTLMLDCKKALDELCGTNRVTLIWVPSHCGIVGNENADALARNGSSTVFFGPEPAIGLSSSAVKASIRRWTSVQFLDVWEKQRGLRQAKTFLSGPTDRAKINKLLALDRSQLRTITGVFTGHWLVNYHLHNIGLNNDPTCRFCGAEVETTAHVICLCDALVSSRFQYLGDRFLEPENVRCIRPSRVLSFLKKIGLTRLYV